MSRDHFIINHLRNLNLKSATVSRKVIQRNSKGIREATYRVSSDSLSLRYHFDKYYGNLTVYFLEERRELSYYHSSYKNYSSKSYRLYDVDKDRLIDHYDLKTPRIPGMERESIDSFIDPFIESIKNSIDQRVEMEAATRIQKAFRGWSIRHKYRYDPHNGLGAFVARKMFDCLIG